MPTISAETLAAANARSRRLRELIRAPKILVMPGAYDVLSAILFEALVASPPSAVEAHVVPMERLLVEWPAVQLTAEGLEWARHGRDLGPRQLSGAPAPPARIVRMLAPDGRLAGLATPAKAAGLLHPTVVFS